MPCQDRIQGMLSGLQGYNLWVESYIGRHLLCVCGEAMSAQGCMHAVWETMCSPPQVACPECFLLSSSLSAGCWTCHLWGVVWSLCWHRAQWIRHIQLFPISFSHTGQHCILPSPVRTVWHSCPYGYDLMVMTYGYDLRNLWHIISQNAWNVSVLPTSQLRPAHCTHSERGAWSILGQNQHQARFTIS